MIIVPDASVILTCVLENGAEEDVSKAIDLQKFPSRTSLACCVEAHAGSKGVIFYDRCYHVLAIQAMGTYVTAGKNYVKRASRKGNIRLLADSDLLS